MIDMTLEELARVVGGTAHGEATVTAPAFVDSREVVAGGLFAAISGEHADGHHFARAALDSGAAAVLASRFTVEPTVVVEDVVTALGVLARHLVARIRLRQVLALTGSQGKTGTKDYLEAILRREGPTVATTGNFNNELGVPLTVLRAEWDTAHLVVEMGARAVGDVAYLCRVAPPTVAAVLNVGTAHIGEFGSREAIALAKGEIVEALPADGTAVLNGDDPLVAAMGARTPARVLTWGASGDVRADNVSSDELGRHRFELVHAGRVAQVRLGQLGAHQVLNAQAAAAMALATGVPLDEVADALSHARPASRWRMELRERADGLVVVNDAYNANPESMLAAVDTLRLIHERSGRRTVAVLGEMRELGAEADAGHRRVGRACAEAGVNVLVTVGEAAQAMADEAGGQGSWCGETVVTAGRDQALAWLRHNVSAADVVLVKASRGAALESVVDGLLHPDEEGTRHS